MKPLLHQASRALTAGASFAPSTWPARGLLRARPSICLTCQYRTAATAGRTNNNARLRPQIPEIWSRRSFSSSARWLEERKPPNEPQPIPMPPPASDLKPVPGDHVQDKAHELVSSLESQARLQEQSNIIHGHPANEHTREKDTQRTPDQVVADGAQQPSQEEPASSTPKNDIADTITRVPDEQLPSHRERQRWNLSKRLSKLMDEVLPKLAAVTQKVNTYTGTDYSGVAALRREIKEQGMLHAPTACLCHD
jgi:sensitive to high expression protein 9